MMVPMLKGFALLAICLSTVTLAADTDPGPAIAPVPGGACTDPKKPTYVLLLNRIPSETVSKATPVDSLDKCGQICTTNQDPCAAYTYDGTTCNVYSAIDTQKTTAADPASPKNVYVKQCVNPAGVCTTSAAADGTPATALVGFARDPVKATDAADCLAKCYSATDITCQSAMYYDNGDCILNTESLYTQPGLGLTWTQITAKDATSPKVYYFSNNCVGAECVAPQITSYTVSDQMKLPATEPSKVVTGQTLNACQDLCTGRTDGVGNTFNCKSFAYNEAAKTCTLYDTQALPLGRATATTDAASKLYQKRCLNSKAACRSGPSYTRVPKMVLVGFAAMVVEAVPTVNDCLDACAKAADFKCASVMYYYKEQECILNTETSTSKPALFIPETTSTVDYFEPITCPTTACPDGGKMAAIKVAGKVPAAPTVSPYSVVGAAGSATTAAQCLDACANLPDFACRSFTFDGTMCKLSYQTILNGPFTDTAGTDTYETVCLSSGACPNDAAAFTYSPKMSSPAVVVASVSGKSVSGCLIACQANPQCGGINYNKLTSACDLLMAKANATASAAAGATAPATGTAGAAASPTTTLSPDFANGNRLKRQAEGLTANATTDFYLNNCPGGGATPITSGVFPQCTYEGMTVKVNSQSVFTGAIFPRMKYATCRTDVNNSNSGLLYLRLPKSMNHVALANLGQTGGGGGYNQGGVPPAPAYGGDQQQQQQGGYGGPQPPVPQPFQPQQGGYGGSPSQQDGGYGQQPAIPSNYGPPQPVASAASYGPAPPQPQGGYRAKRQGSPPGIVPDTPVLGAANTAGGNSGANNQAQGGFGQAQGGFQPTGGAGFAGNGGGFSSGGGSGYGAAPQSSFSGRTQGGGADNIDEVDCGVTCSANGTCCATVIVQNNEYGVPGLVTSNDGMYRVCCDYGSGMGQKVIASGSPVNVVGPTPAYIQPRGKINMGSPISMSLGTAASGAGQNAVTATLGDILQLQWEMMATDEIGFSVEYCIASPFVAEGGAGQPSQPSTPSTYGGGQVAQAPGFFPQSPGSDQSGSQGGYGGQQQPQQQPQPAQGGYGGQPDQGGYGSQPQPQPTQGGYGGQPQQQQPQGQSGYGRKKRADVGPPGFDARTPNIGSDGSFANPTLELIKDGCPTPAVSGKLMPGFVTQKDSRTLVAPLQAFRFDGFRIVQIQCQLKLCKGPCTPHQCPAAGNVTAGSSFGRKKRHASGVDNGLAHESNHLSDDLEVGKYVVPRRQKAQAVITIVDKVSDLVKPIDSSYNFNPVLRYGPTQEKRHSAVEVTHRAKGQMCLPKSTFMGVSVFLGMATALQMAVIFAYIIHRSRAQKKI